MAAQRTEILACAVDLMERRWMPDRVIRAGIRRLLSQRLSELHHAYDPAPEQYLTNFLERLNASGIAEQTEAANEQHYELPTEFFDLMLGPQRKYSSGFWPEPKTTLNESEEAMLALTAVRADLQDGQTILELGCGWGSLTLWMARHYPNAKITAVSNSRLQREWIERQTELDGLSNVTVITEDMNEFSYDGQADRVVSVEMFEHMRNYAPLFGRVKSWLKSDGKLFIHIFAHRAIPYLFESRGTSDWMARYFFSGGTMPSHDLFRICQSDFSIEQDWVINGEHYSRTLEAWLDKLDANRAPAMKILTEHYGAEADRWFQRWRIFLMACSELFAFDRGEEWHVSHYRLRPHD